MISCSFIKTLKYLGPRDEDRRARRRRERQPREVEAVDEAGVGGGLGAGLRGVGGGGGGALAGAVVPGELDDAALVLEVGVLELGHRGGGREVAAEAEEGVAARLAEALVDAVVCEAVRVARDEDARELAGDVVVLADLEEVVLDGEGLRLAVEAGDLERGQLVAGARQSECFLKRTYG